MVKEIVNNIIKNLLHIPGKKLKKEIVIIESDDWGSVRMPSKAIYSELVNKGIKVDNLSYNRYDSLESEEDLTLLFEVLTSVKDKKDKPAVITANTIVGNPDFERIKESNYEKYYYEPFTETFKRYSKHSKSFKLWKEGITKGVFKPQFHGREHLNIKRWMTALQKDIGKARIAFDYGMYDLSTSLTIGENSFMEAFNYENISEIEEQKIILSEGLSLFERLFGYRATTFTAPCYVWSSKLNEHLCTQGINAFQGIRYQFEPIPGKKHRFKKKYHYTGQKNEEGQVYLVRNAFFEPSENLDYDWIRDILKRAEISFRWGKPLIISTHRVNYIGFIEPKNRDRNLKLLYKLLKLLTEKYPDIEFMSSDKLTSLILKEQYD